MPFQAPSARENRYSEPLFIAKARRDGLGGLAITQKRGEVNGNRLEVRLEAEQPRNALQPYLLL